MNIQEAKETIEKALRAYFARDEAGNLLVPLRQQRPILLIGPPGIGKTAIMEQIAEECGVGLVAYTMTHHTRQSAMGLPEICTRGIEGKMVHTTEYTMSEIIASIYDCMEQTGKKRGILFLDEINCVSETLAPVMLQLLQDKKFGNQRIPDDWLIVAAGNPPEYNKSVREFDVATLDRVRKIEVLPELSVWLSYAEKNQIHSAVTTYLMAHSDHFYSVSQEADEKRFVTARGWEDLSAVLKSYEILNFPVDEALIGQYLQEEKTAEEFSSYYRIYEKYGQDYGVEEILTGAFSGKIMAEKQKMAANGSAEERSVLLSLLHAALQKEASACQKQEHTAKELSECFRQFTGLCRQKKDETYASWLRQKEQGFAAVSYTHLSGVLNYRGKRIELTKNEWRILQFLLENKGKAVSRDMLMMHLWESDSFIDDNTLTVNVTRLRKKLEEAGLTDFIPVSYTHLDVYKRQHFSFYRSLPASA